MKHREFKDEEIHLRRKNLNKLNYAAYVAFIAKNRCIEGFGGKCVVLIGSKSAGWFKAVTYHGNHQLGHRRAADFVERFNNQKVGE